MSNNQNKSYVVLPGGLTCKPVNPYSDIDAVMATSAEYVQRIKKLYEEFDKTAPTIPITEVMPEGETFDGVEVELWQMKNHNGDWATDATSFNRLKSFASFKAYWHPIEVRKIIAIKPIKAIEPVKTITDIVNKGKDWSGVEKDLRDVVENKEPIISFEDILKKHGIYEYDVRINAAINEYIHTKQPSIEGIVGFVLEKVAEQLFHPKNNSTTLLDILTLKTDIIKEYNNGK